MMSHHNHPGARRSNTSSAAGNRRSEERDRNSHRTRTTARPNGRAKHDDAAKDADGQIPGAGENPVMEAAEAAAMSSSSEFDRVLSVKSRPLIRGTPEAAAEQVSGVIMPAMAGFKIGANYGLHWYLAATFHFTNLLLAMKDHPEHLAAMKEAAGMSPDVDGRPTAKPYMKTLQGLGPLPADDGSGERRRMQNRYSNYNCAMEAAAEQDLDAEEFFDRLVRDRGVEKLIEEPRQAAKADLEEPGGRESKGRDWDGAAAAGSEARSQRRKRDRQRKEEAHPGSTADARAGTSRGGKAKGNHDEDQDDLPFGDRGAFDSEITAEVGVDIRPRFAKAGKFLMVSHVSGSGRHHIAVRYAQPLPSHTFGSDGAALDAMIRFLRK